MHVADKIRNATCLVYLDDLGKTYGELLEFLDGLHIPCACSPVHDSDTYTQGDVGKWVARHTDKETGKIDAAALALGIPEVGQFKKKHVHVILCAPGPWPIAKFCQVMQPFADVCHFEQVNSVPSLLRYFAHMDSPEKHQYSPLEIHGFGGIDLSPLMRIDKVSALETLLDVLDHLSKSKTRYYHSLVNWSISTGDIETICCVTGRAAFFSAYFKSLNDERAARKKREQLENDCSKPIS